MITVLVQGGRRWWIRRQWWAWRPRPSRPLRWCVGFADSLLGVLVLVPLVLLAIPYLLNWACCLVCTPFALLARLVLHRPWPIVVRDATGFVHVVYAQDWPDTSTVMYRVRDEIIATGAPAGVAPAPPAVPPLDRAPLDRAPRWVARLSDWFATQRGLPPRE